MLVPYIIEDTGHGERSMDIFSRLLADRIVLIGTPIDDRISNTVIAQLLFLINEDPKSEIKIYINSPGGDLNAGLAIFDTIRYLAKDCKISTLCVGQACSVAAVLLASGTEGFRYALPHSRIMIHQPFGDVTGTASDIVLRAKEYARLKDNMLQILFDLTGHPIDKIRMDIDRDKYMSPEEAKEYHLIDVVCQRNSSASNDVPRITLESVAK